MKSKNNQNDWSKKFSESLNKDEELKKEISEFEEFKLSEKKYYEESTKLFYFAIGQKQIEKTKTAEPKHSKANNNFVEKEEERKLESNSKKNGKDFN